MWDRGCLRLAGTSMALDGYRPVSYVLSIPKHGGPQQGLSGTLASSGPWSYFEMRWRRRGARAFMLGVEHWTLTLRDYTRTIDATSIMALVASDLFISSCKVGKKCRLHWYPQRTKTDRQPGAPKLFSLSSLSFNFFNFLFLKERMNNESKNMVKGDTSTRTCIDVVVVSLFSCPIWLFLGWCQC